MKSAMHNLTDHGLAHLFVDSSTVEGRPLIMYLLNDISEPKQPPEMSSQSWRRVSEILRRLVHELAVFFYVYRDFPFVDGPTPADLDSPLISTTQEVTKPLTN